MFVKAAELKKLIKEAWECGVLICSKKNDSLLVQGGYWLFYSDMKLINTKILGTLVELAGTLPADGESYRASKDGMLQYEFTETVHWETVEDLIDNADDKALATRSLVEMECGKLIRLFRMGSASRFFNAIVPGMITRKELIEEQGEPSAEGPFYRDNYLYWTNYTGCFAIVPYSIDSDHWTTKLIDALEDLELGEYKC